jgi:hypothetical protein
MPGDGDENAGLTRQKDALVKSQVRRLAHYKSPLVKAWGVTLDDEHYRVQRDVLVR